MRILVSGQKQFGAAVFKLCRAEGHEVVAVASPPLSSSYATTGEQLPDRLRFAAEMARVPWISSELLRADSVPKGTDLIIAAHSHAFLGRKTRSRTALGAIGYHPSLLPLHRGRDAVRWALHMKERITGGTAFWLTDTLDGGPIAAQAHAFVRPGDTPATLWREVLFPLGLRLIKRVLADLSAGRKVAVPQDDKLATWEPSWDRPPIFRPELPELGKGAWVGRMTVSADEAEDALTGFVDANDLSIPAAWQVPAATPAYSGRAANGRTYPGSSNGMIAFQSNQEEALAGSNGHD
ncbi:MAG TPA: formyltransferase family protein [Candidatus Angelobacter sp.]|nr:formyltransferase family protein [Candidatus Angelobacter sp.]